MALYKNTNPISPQSGLSIGDLKGGVPAPGAWMRPGSFAAPRGWGGDGRRPGHERARLPEERGWGPGERSRGQGPAERPLCGWRPGEGELGAGSGPAAPPLSRRTAKFTTPLAKELRAFPGQWDQAAATLTASLFLPRLPAQTAAGSAADPGGDQLASSAALRCAPRSSSSPRSLGSKGHRLRPVPLPAAAELEIRKQRALFVKHLTAEFIKV